MKWLDQGHTTAQNSLTVQLLRFSTSTAGATGEISDPGMKTLHACGVTKTKYATQLLTAEAAAGGRSMSVPGGVRTKSFQEPGTCSENRTGKRQPQQVFQKCLSSVSSVPWCTQLRMVQFPMSHLPPEGTPSPGESQLRSPTQCQI